ncbi:MAG: hypothetical protein ACYCYL_11755 [Acidithiobacillus sp.]
MADDEQATVAVQPQPPNLGMLGFGLKHWLATLPVAGAIWYVPHSAPLWAAQ